MLFNGARLIFPASVFNKALQYFAKANGETWNILLAKNMFPHPRDPITLSDDDWGVQSPPQQGI